MADDFIHKLTLNCLISKNQLFKLNKTLKNTANEKKRKEMESYRPRVEELFTQMISGNAPENIMLEVRDSFDAFVAKSVYYLKALDCSEKTPEIEIQDDIDYDQEEQQISNGNVGEEEEEEEDDN
jgi:hypothetical protein